MKKTVSEKDTLFLSRSSCFELGVAAIEVYPKECQGAIYARSVRDNHGQMAIPYQIANRTRAGTESNSEVLLYNITNTGSSYKQIADFHSHTFDNFVYKGGFGPSKVDINSMEKGSQEVIIHIYKNSDKKSRLSCINGKVYMSIGQYRMIISAYKHFGISPGTKNKPLIKYLPISISTSIKSENELN
jgi:hypothetical protein